MKKFKFQLDAVLNYKQQVLDARMNEYGEAVEQSNAQQLVLDELKRRFAEYSAEFREKKLTGLAAIEALKYQSCIEAMTEQIKKETEKLQKLRDIEEQKRLAVVAARQETASLEKLEEIKRKEYDAAIMKAEEKELDDLVAARSVGSN